MDLYTIKGRDDLGTFRLNPDLNACAGGHSLIAVSGDGRGFITPGTYFGCDYGQLTPVNRCSGYLGLARCNGVAAPGSDRCWGCA